MGKLHLTYENLSWLSESQILSLTLSQYLETCRCVLSLILFRTPAPFTYLSKTIGVEYQPTLSCTTKKTYLLRKEIKASLEEWQRQSEKECKKIGGSKGITPGHSGEV